MKRKYLIWGAFLTNNNVVIFLTYLSIALTVYYSVHVRHKRINYILLRKNDRENVIAFWNGCSQTIFREDIHYFYGLVNTETSVKKIYSTDQDIELSISLGEDILDRFHGMLFNRHTRRLNISFEYMMSKNGYIIDIDNIKGENFLYANLYLLGRIRGEKDDSVKSCMPLYYSTFTSAIKNPHVVSKRTMMDVLSAITSLITIVSTLLAIFVEKIVISPALGIVGVVIITLLSLL